MTTYLQENMFSCAMIVATTHESPKSNFFVFKQSNKHKHPGMLIRCQRDHNGKKTNIPWRHSLQQNMHQGLHPTFRSSTKNTGKSQTPKYPNNRGYKYWNLWRLCHSGNHMRRIEHFSSKYSKHLDNPSSHIQICLPASAMACTLSNTIMDEQEAAQWRTAKILGQYISQHAT